MEAIKELIHPELLVLIPVLYFIGLALKKSTVPDKFIPLLLGLSGIVLAVIYMAATTPVRGAQDVFNLIFAGITQGILCAGCSVYANQLVKQSKKDDEGE